MKVIHQLISYLDSQGILSTDDIRYLRTEGFLPVEAGSDDDSFLCDEQELGEDDLWDRREGDPALQREAIARRRKGRIQRKGREVSALEIDDWLAERIPGWAAALEPLVQVAGRLGTPASLKEALVILHRADPRRLDATLAAALQARQPSFEQLWAALSVEEYRAVAGGSRICGPALRAYRAVLAADLDGPPGRCGWILRHSAIAWVFHLARAQRRLAAACGRLATTRPEWLWRELGRARQDGAVRAFALLDTARWFVHSGQPDPRPIAPTECTVIPARLDGAEWLQPWSQAYRMDPKAVGPLMARCLSVRALTAASDGEVRAVQAWNAGMKTVNAALQGHCSAVCPVALLQEGCELVYPTRWGRRWWQELLVGGTHSNGE